jgi:hypothetical protein
VWLHDRPADQERRQTLEWTWRDKRMKERGMQSDWRILRDRLQNRDLRIARQEAKIKAINEESAKAAESDSAPAASPLPPGVGAAQATPFAEPPPDKPQPIPPSVGAAAKGEPLEFPAGTGTKNAYTEEMQKRMGWERMTQTERLTDQQALDEAMTDFGINHN